jgi:hypothetical protein
LIHVPSLVIFSLGMVSFTIAGMQLQVISNIEQMAIPSIKSNIQLSAEGLRQKVEHEFDIMVAKAANLTNEAIGALETKINQNVFDNVGKYDKVFEEDIKQSRDETFKIVRDNLKLEAMLPILQTLSDCIFQKIFSVLSFVNFINGWKLDLPKLSEDWFSKTSKKQIAKLIGSLERLLFGSREDGLLYKVLHKWRLHAFEEMKFAAVSTGLGLCIFFQGLLWLLFFKP